MTALLVSLLLQVRIVTFGDSLTAPRAGVITYSDVLERSLAEEGFKVEVINRGVAGNTSTQARSRFTVDVLDNNPKLVIIQLGANDAAIDVWKHPPATKPRVDVTTFRKNVEYFVETLRARKTRVILMTPNRFAWTPRLISLYGRPPYSVSSDDGFNFMLDDYCDVVRQIARAGNVDFVDPAKAVPTSALLDGMHPNTEGHGIVARLLLPVVRRLLRTL